MRVYQAQSLELEPIIMMADDWKKANAEFHFAISRAFGFMPTMSFELLEPDEDDLPNIESLRQLIRSSQPGFVVPTYDGWRRNPFDSE